jgi:succinate-acetate transporter protein
MESTTVEGKVTVVDTWVNPGALGGGLLGWLAIIFAGIGLKWYGVGAMVEPMMVFAGVGFLICALWGGKKGDAFTFWAFGIIAIFDFVFVFMFMFPAMHLTAGPTPNEMSTLVISFAILVVAMCIVTLYFPSRLFSATIALAAILFMTVGINFSISPPNEGIETFIGVLSIIVGIMALYMSIGEIINHCTRAETCPMLLKKPKKA